jgi:MFS family permease
MTITDTGGGSTGNEATAGRGAVPDSGDGARGFFNRELNHYPPTGKRYGYLAIVVAATIVLYYLYYVVGTTTTLFLPYFHMSFTYFLGLLVVSNAIGAFSALLGGISDKVGRANLTILGVLIVGLIQLFAIPHCHTSLQFSIAYSFIGFFEGIILVVTPALIRDFSPQMGRGAAMGFWALGPTVGSLVASLVATRTVNHLHPWQDQFIISGIVCMGIFVISFFFLKDLAPKLRDQLMVSMKERALVEARARGIDIETAIAHPFRTMMKWDLVTSSLAISLFLLIYYASVSVLVIYWAVVFNKTTSDANGINTWYWSFDSVMLIVIGVISDKVRVRKPFMVLGAIGTIVTTYVFIQMVNHPHTSYYSLVTVVSFLGVFIAVAYTPWMAAYTEAVEARNPALAATGLAVWGWVLRIVVAASFLVLPHVITTATPIVNNQYYAAQLQALQAAQSHVASPGGGPVQPAPQAVIDQLNATGALPMQTLATILAKQPTTYAATLAAVTQLPPAMQKQALALQAFQPLATAIQNGESVGPVKIAAVAAAGSPQLAQLLQQEKIIVPAQKAAPQEWKNWWWVCLGGQVIFLGLVFTMRGRWSPRKAREDDEEREALVERELAAIRAAGTGT